MAIMSKKTWDVNQEKKKIGVINIGGGGIGAVFLLGGALATAAFVSAFVVRKNGRSSGEDRRHHNPPPEINKQNEQDEANKGQKRTAVVLDQPSDVGGAKTEVESDNDTAFLVSTQRSTLEINGEKAGDFYYVEEAGEETPSSISPTKSETDTISDGSVVTEEGYPLSDKKLPFETPNITLANEIEFHLTKADVSNEISKEIENFEQVCIEEERAERETDDDGEMEGKGHEEANEIVEMQLMQEENIEVGYDQEEMIEVNVEQDNGVEAVHIDQMEVQNNANMNGSCSDNEGIAIESTKLDLDAIELKLSENDSSLPEINVFEDGLKSIVIIEHEKVEGDDEERALPVETVETTQEGDNGNEGSEEEQVKYIEEQLVTEEEKCEVKDDQIPYENKQENRGFEVPKLKQELIFQEDVEVVKDDEANEEEADSEGLETNEKKTSMQLVNGQPKDDENDSEEDMVEEIKEEMIFYEDVEVVKEEIASEKAAESVEMNENKNLVQFVVDQPKLAEDDLKRNIGEEIEDLSVKKNDLIMEISEDEENGKDNIEDFDDDETELSDEAEEISEGSGHSSMESNSEAVYPVDSPQETTVEPQETKLLNQEVEGKIQEDKAINKDGSHFIIGKDSESFEHHKVKSLNEAFLDKYFAKNHSTYLMRQRMLIGTLCVMSSVSCSWFFGLSSVELCLIVFLTMVLSTMVTSRQGCKAEKI